MHCQFGRPTGPPLRNTNMKLTNRVQRIKPSPTLAITAKAAALKAQGVDVIGFGAGEPDFDTPQHVKDAAIAAIQAGFTKYTDVAGTVELKDAIIAKLKKDNGLEYARDQILVSCGAKHSLYNIAQALFEEGDEVIIQAPYWVSYPDQVLLNDAKPVVVETDDKTGFKITPALLEKAITPKSKAFILNSPSNPTGAAYSRDELKALADVIVKHNLICVSDEIYEKISYDGFKHVSIASLGEEIKKRTIVVNGLSKSHAMTGWRMGYAAGPKEWIASMNKIQGQVTSNITSITQKAAVAALNGPQDDLTKMGKAFIERRDAIVSRFEAIPGITCLKPQGAFYVFPNVSALLGKKTASGKTISSADDFANYLLEEYKVAVVSGEGFGAPGYMRLSYACSMENIQKGLDRISDAVKQLK